MERLSVVIITFNEEHNIGRCLDSVHAIADDIVVIDSYSTDNTKSICLAHGARVIDHAFDGHIEQKNFAISQAKFPFILSLDADEALSPKLASSIAQAKLNKTADGYSMNRLTNYCGRWIKHCGWYPDKKLRLWDSKLGSWQGTNPHDEYRMRNNAKISHLQGDILHYSYYTYAEHIARSLKYADISAKAMYEQGKKCSALKPYLSASARFIRDYLVKTGFLDGKYGYRICKMNAVIAYRKYRGLRCLNQNNYL